MTIDELLESAVDDLGFDPDGVRRFDYGARVILAALGADGQLSFSEEGSGKGFASLPGARKADDAAKVKDARAEVARIKKELARLRSAQLARLEEALVSARRWVPSTWRVRYAEHPLMTRFAQGLLWGVFSLDDDALGEPFYVNAAGEPRRLDDGEVQLSDGTQRIGLVHPARLTPEARDHWRTFFTQRGRSAPFEQLARAVYTQADVPAELKQWLLTLRRADAARFVRTADRLGYNRGPRRDGGAIYDTHRAFGAWEVQISHTWYAPEALDGHEIEVEGFEVRHDGAAVGLRELPVDVFSEVVRGVRLMTGTP